MMKKHNGIDQDTFRPIVSEAVFEEVKLMRGMAPELITQFHVRRLYGYTLDMTSDEVHQMINDSDASDENKEKARGSYDTWNAYDLDNANKMWAIAKPSINLENVPSTKPFWMTYLS
jgi:hypothetical protein